MIHLEIIIDKKCHYVHFLDHYEHQIYETCTGYIEALIPRT